jgi:hypothetical protein
MLGRSKAFSLLTLSAILGNPVRKDVDDIEVNVYA